MKTPRNLPALFRILVPLLLVLALAPARAQNAYPPGTISYQGFLTDANGVPLATNTPANYEVIFRIYSSSTGDTNTAVLWAEDQTVTVDKGYFSVQLGQGSQVGSQPYTNNLTSLFTGPNASDRYVGLTVNFPGGGVEIAPRLRLLSSPYSFLAANANSLVDAAGNPLVSTFGTMVGINKASPAYPLDVNGDVNATSFSGNGSLITAINANNISSGQLGDGLLSANVALLNKNQTFTGLNSFINNHVGIGGFANSSHQLLVQGDDQSGGGDSSQLAIFGGSNPNKQLLIGYKTFGAYSYASLQSIYQGVQFTPLILQPDAGNVGIGVINPQPLNTLQVGNAYMSGNGWGAEICAPGVFGNTRYGLDVQISNPAGYGGAGLLVDNAVNGDGSTPLILARNNNAANQVFAAYADGAISLGNTGHPADNGLSLAYNMHMNDQQIFLRGGIDHNHGVGYNGLSGTYSVDGPALYGFVGGVLGTTSGGQSWAFAWNTFYASTRFGLLLSSDRDLKENFKPVESQAVLAKVCALPMTDWNYKEMTADRHIGPMAQDFAAAFGYGPDDKHISVGDEIGVALTAVQGLNEVVQQKEQEIQSLKKELQELRTLVEGLAKTKAEAK